MKIYSNLINIEKEHKNILVNKIFSFYFLRFSAVYRSDTIDLLNQLGYKLSLARRENKRSRRGCKRTVIYYESESAKGKWAKCKQIG